ncbi:PQQ-binding-like beta-propeller repeat protein [Cellulomonas sp. ICMP 17802]|uniref:outer membrane protein assembly factor BamB family protein n=1 Tax=Cellulomonas sp. ICMP 17802 TaxID=3239199 RepID=UPI00351AD81D
MADRRLAARMQLVEIEDASTTTTWSRHPDDEPPPGIPLGHPPVLRWWPVAVLVVLALLAAAMLASARDRAFVARIVAVPGLVRPLDAAPAPLWHVRGRTANGTVLSAEGALVVLAEGDTDWDLTSHDPATGDVRWTVPVAPVSRSGFESTSVICPAQAADVGSLVLCLVRQPRVVYSDEASIQEQPHLAVLPLSARDGTRVGGWQVRGSVVAIDRVADDLVIGIMQPDGHLQVQRRSGRSGAVVWSYVSPVALAQLLSATVRVMPPIVVLDGESTIVLDVDDGHALVTGARFTGLQVAALGDRFATWAPVGGGQMRDVDGTPLYALSSLPAQLAADDGSEPGLVMVDDGPQLGALDLATGTETWRTRTALDPRLLVSHRLVVSGAGTYGVLDASDGRKLWSVDTGDALAWPPLSDGTLVLGTGSSPDGKPELWGRGLSDGVRYWAVPLPEHVRHVDAVGGHLVVRTPNDLIAYG